jgi:hypothetical protein
MTEKMMRKKRKKRRKRKNQKRRKRRKEGEWPCQSRLQRCQHAEDLCCCCCRALSYRRRPTREALEVPKRQTRNRQRVKKMRKRMK